jgi:hypothetical protein
VSAEEEIRRAAALMRERAQPMVTGTPWVDGRGHVQMQSGFIIAGSMGMLASAHIASWHPAVALAVADWLDDVAEAMADDAAEHTVSPYESEQALAVARAYLAGEQP